MGDDTRLTHLSTRIYLVLLLAASLCGCGVTSSATNLSGPGAGAEVPADATPLEKVIAGAVEQTTQTVIYDPSYVKLNYPMGDVPPERGVCADVIVRAFRKSGLDLQKEVHEDMKRHFGSYPNRWGAKRPDRNIDHRRVANLMTYFERKGKFLPLSRSAGDYLPGDVVAWDLGNGLLHIGIVVDEKSPSTGNHQVVHNIGAGAKLEDVLFHWKIIGRYRFFNGDS